MLHTHNRVRQNRAFKLKPSRGSVRQASCKEINCIKMQEGWITLLSPHVPRHADVIACLRRGDVKRAFIEAVISDDLIEFRFSAGQDCFEKHYIQDMVFNIGRKDTGTPVLWYPDGDAFVEDSDKHLRKIKEVVDNG